MAKFDNCHAEGNGLSGFRTNNPDTEFRNSTARNNAGDGFLDLSGPVLVQRMHAVLSAIENELGSQSEFKAELVEIQQEVHKPKPEKSKLAKAWDSLQGKMLAQGVDYVASNSGKLLGQLGKMIENFDPNSFPNLPNS